jgi:serine/threonine-protein kinase
MSEEKIGDYTILGSLGRGGFGSVYKARGANGNLVALKVLNPQVLDNQKVVKKFFHEAMILAKLDHPNICKLIEFFPDSDNYAIVMEFVEGTELKDLMAQQPNGLLPFNQAFRIAKQSLEAFQFAHNNGVLHRDIKPANMMIDKAGNCKIMDFGIAKVAGAATHDTAASMLSVHYTPPERFDPSRTVDTRSDIYSLGLVFYELFTGRRPFDADETSQIMFWHLNEIPEPPNLYVSGLPLSISDAILTALEKEPEDRFQDFKEFSEALGEGDPNVDYTATVNVDSESTMIGDQTIITSPTTPKPSKAKRRKKEKGLSAPLIASISATVVVLIIVAVFIITQYLPQKGAMNSAAPAAPETVKREIAVKGGTLNSKGFTEITHTKDSSVMVYIPEGIFTMGSDNYSPEQPVQQVLLDSYLIDKYPVTNAQFKKFVDETQYQTVAEKEQTGMVRIGVRFRQVPEANWKMPDGMSSIEGKENHPVTQISYTDALEYCKWAGKDLPTEAQWEKAARGPDGNIYPWGSAEPDDTKGNFDNIVGTTTPVTEYDKGQSYYGIFDMAGNIRQWCRDWYAEGERQPKNHSGPESGTERVIKNGSFSEGIDPLRSANRDRYDPGYSSFLFGFRCATTEID